MPKMKQTVKMGPVTRTMSAAAKRPDITSAYLDSIEEALDDFDDEIASISSKQRSTAYENLVTSYKAVLTKIWERAKTADIGIILDSVVDKQLVELERMKKMLQPQAEWSKVIEEQREVPELDNILGALTSRLPAQKLPNKEVCELIGAVFTDLAAAHLAQRRAAKGISDLAGLITPEQFTLILVAAVPPTLHLVLPKGNSSPLAAPQPQPTKTDTEQDRKQITNYCKSRILPDPKQTALMKCDKKSPTQVVAATIYCTLERKYFVEKMTQADIAVLFNITPTQLTKAMTDVAYESGPHSTARKQKVTATTSMQQEQTPAQKKARTAEDTLSSSSSSSDSSELLAGLP